MFAWAAQMLASFLVPCLGNEKRCSLVWCPCQTEGLSYLQHGCIIYNLLHPKTSFNICLVETAGSNRSSGRWRQGAWEPTQAANSFKYTALNGQKCSSRLLSNALLSADVVVTQIRSWYLVFVQTVYGIVRCLSIEWRFSKPQLWVRA